MAPIQNGLVETVRGCAVALFWSAGASSLGAGIVGVGVAPGMSGSELYCISADGTAAGGRLDAENLTSALRWAVSGPIENLGNLAGGSVAESHAISGDGSVIFGMFRPAVPNPTRAFRWTAADGMQSLGNLPNGEEYEIFATSGDGSFAVGSAAGTISVGWRQGQGLFYLDPPPGATRFFARGISSDGSVVVGGLTSGSHSHAFRWTSLTGYQDLSTSTSPEFGATSVSGDGEVIGGALLSPSGNSRAMLWTAAFGIEDLGTGPATWTDAVILGMNGDGSVAVGQGVNDNGGYAMLWRRDIGIVALRDYLQSHGVNVSDWPFLFNASAVSADGTRIVGFGRHLSDGVPRYEGFIATIDACGSADFNHDGDYGTDADIEAFFSCLAGSCCPACGSVDFNGDGSVGTDSDIESFFRVLAGGSC